MCRTRPGGVDRKADREPADLNENGGIGVIPDAGSDEFDDGDAMALSDVAVALASGRDLNGGTPTNSGPSVRILAWRDLEARREAVRNEDAY